MKRETDDYLRFAHALTQSLPAVETFSFGTRLTRLTQSLRHKDHRPGAGRDRALGRRLAGRNADRRKPRDLSRHPTLRPRLARRAGRRAVGWA